MAEIRHDRSTPTIGAGVPLPPPPVTTDLRWRSLTGLGVALQALFTLTMAALVGLAGASVVLGGALEDAEGAAGFGPFANAVDALDVYVGIMALLDLLWLGTAVVFIIWMFRLAKNNELLGRTGTSHAPGWAIGGWFVPFANLVIPYRMMRELWQGADGAIPPSAWRSVDRSRLVTAWWSLYLAGWGLFSAADFGLASDELSFGFTLGSAGESSSETVARLLDEPGDPFGVGLKLMAIAVVAAAALAALLMVRRLSLRQTAAAEALGVVPTATTEAGAVPRPAPRRWPWVLVPVAAAALGLLVFVPVGNDRDEGGHGGSLGGEVFRDPEGLYEIELHPDWEPIEGGVTGTEAFAVATPSAGFQPNVVLFSTEDASDLDEAAYLDAVLARLEEVPSMDVLDAGVVAAPSGNDLAYVEWLNVGTGVATLHGYTVIDVSHGYAAVAELAASRAGFDEVFAAAEPYLLTLRFEAEPSREPAPGGGSRVT